MKAACFIALSVAGAAMADLEVNRTMGKLEERLRGASSLHRANLDDAILGKAPSATLSHTGVQARPVAPRAQPQSLKPASSYSLASLPGPSALKNLVASKIEANNRACPARDLTVKAEGSELAPAGLYTGEKVGDAAEVGQYMFNPALKEPASKAKVEAMAGVTAPLGLWDPLGIATKVPEGQLLYFREAELKHGRVCMLAFLGLLVGEAHAYNYMPVLPFESALGVAREIQGNGPAYLLGTPAIQTVGAAQFWPLALAMLHVEEVRHAYDIQTNPNMAPGDYGWDPLGMKPKTDKDLKELQNKELNNGRLAMFAVMGILGQELLTGQNQILNTR